ncbi:alpha/beta hydrolase [Amycolatopsis thermalba]|uniref:Alpha/beta hydrolase n=1 Tax=Amycolatopsis thermalba TaxID=944492 RepID=A0ABY4NSF4_9PSEU|nr:MULTISPECIES: alpha/beta hydrolase [Amycolatopsis]UQS23011.1 alpha/beta hydrolase [Amycolatopsis thermalba]
MTEHFAPVVRGSGPGLLLAHGAGGSVHANFGPILDDLAQTHTVVGRDYPVADRPSLDGLADALVQTAVDAGVERFTILGYSLGTAVAVRAVTRHPERVTGLVLTAGFARPSNQMRLALAVWRELLDLGNEELLAKYVTFAGVGGQFLNALTPRELEEAVAGVVVPDGTAELVDLVASVDTTAELGRVTVPTRVIGTRQDVLVPIDVQRDLAEGIPGAEYVEIASGHSMQAEARDEWLARIREFRH